LRSKAQVCGCVDFVMDFPPQLALAVHGRLLRPAFCHRCH
jgi:hypothetical protein